ncbi:hypothetical protein PAPHI01_2196 [Pancytospora philotis]|nr:hypothetical protein PAPHI01_2196 [Pancytospora philotis]
MKPQEWYDIALCVKTFGPENGRELTRGMMVRTGVWYAPEKILESYATIEEESRQHGYKEPLSFIEDYFQGMYHTRVPVLYKPFDAAAVRKSLGLEAVQAVQSPGDARPQDAAAARKKRKTAVSSAAEAPDAKSSTVYPALTIPRPQQGAPATAPPANGPGTRARAATQPSKKRNRDAKSAEQRAADAPVQKDAAEGSVPDTFMDAYFNDFDMDFRRVMARIRNPASSRAQGKAQYFSDFDCLRKYFESKLSIDLGNTASAERLSVSIVHLIKKVQTKLFNGSDPEKDRLLVFLKEQLGSFYSYYEDKYL